MPKKTAQKAPRAASLETQFSQVAAIIRQGASQAHAAVNSAMVETYFRVGGYVSDRVRRDEWGKGVVAGLADYLAGVLPNPRGFSASNLWRMKQFFELYEGYEILAPLVRELSWTHNLIIMSKCKTDSEREFYVRMAIGERLTKRELERSIQSNMFERTIESKPKLSTALREIHPGSESVFRDTYALARDPCAQFFACSPINEGPVSRRKASLSV